MCKNHQRTGLKKERKMGREKKKDVGESTRIPEATSIINI